MIMMMMMISSGLTHPYEAEDSLPLGRLQKVARLQMVNGSSHMSNSLDNLGFQGNFTLAALPSIESSSQSDSSHVWMSPVLREN